MLPDSISTADGSCSTQFRKRLSEGEYHISDTTIDFLLRGQAATSIDMDTVCWRTAKKTVQTILRSKWHVLMKQFRIKDVHGRRRLDRQVIQSILGRADVGMSASLIEIVTANLNVEDDSKIDYDALLSGPCVTASSTSTIPRVLLPSRA